MYNGISLSHKKGGHSDTGCNMDAPWGHPVNWKRPVTKRQILEDSIYMNYQDQIPRGKKQDGGCQELGAGGMGGLGMRLEFHLEMIKVLEMNDNICTTVWIYLKLLTVYLEMVNMVNLCYVYFTSLKNFTEYPLVPSLQMFPYVLSSF